MFRQGQRRRVEEALLAVLEARTLAETLLDQRAAWLPGLAAEMDPEAVEAQLLGIMEAFPAGEKALRLTLIGEGTLPDAEVRNTLRRVKALLPTLRGLLVEARQYRATREGEVIPAPVGGL